MAITPNSATDRSAQHSAVAPAWHTIVLLLILFGFSFTSAHTESFTPLGLKFGHTFSYLVVIIFEWALVAFVWFGTSQRGVRIGDLVGGSWARPIYFLRDIVIAIAFLIVAGCVLSGLDYFVKATPNQAIHSLLPQRPIEIVPFLATSLTAAFCEELIYRGYLQRQFTALTHGLAGGIVLQAIVFALNHAYQGWKFVLLIAALAVMLGLLAYWRKSLRPGMVAHALQDGVTGIVASHLLR